MPNKIDALYSEVSKSYEVGSIDDFKKYLADPKKRQLFFKEVIAPEYDVKSIDDFDEAYGFKKKKYGVSFSRGSKRYFLGFWRDAQSWAFGVFCKEAV
jgi:hypothetical protein